jgi:hypothetical protein
MWNCFTGSKAVSSMQGALASLPPHSTTLRASQAQRALRHAAQGCAKRYPGIAVNRPPTPTPNRNAVPSRLGGARRNRGAVRTQPDGVVPRLPRVLRTLGCMTEGLWPSRRCPEPCLIHTTPTRCGPATSRNASEQRCQSTKSMVSGTRSSSASRSGLMTFPGSGSSASMTKSKSVVGKASPVARESTR